MTGGELVAEELRYPLAQVACAGRAEDVLVVMEKRERDAGMREHRYAARSADEPYRFLARRQHPGNVRRAAVELGRDWRTDRMLRRLEAMLLVGDAESVLVVSGSGDVIEPDDGIAAIGSGGTLALSAARALSRHSEMSVAEIAETALRIAAEICIYTNDSISVVTLP